MSNIEKYNNDLKNQREIIMNMTGGVIENETHIQHVGIECSIFVKITKETIKQMLDTNFDIIYKLLKHRNFKFHNIFNNTNYDKSKILEIIENNTTADEHEQIYIVNVNSTHVLNKTTNEEILIVDDSVNDAITDFTTFNNIPIYEIHIFSKYYPKAKGKLIKCSS
jgi:hypothetical protein